MNFFKLHIGDYESATGHLTWDEDMAYSRLMRVYYRTEKPIPEAAKYRLIRATTKSQKRACDRVLSEYFTLVDTLWINRRCEEEVSAYQQICKKNKEVGNRGGRPSGFQKQTQVVSKNNPNHKPDTISQIPEARKIFKPDLDVTESPTRGKEVNVKTVLKNIPEEQNQEQLERNRRVAVAVAQGNLELAREIREGRA